MRMALLAAAALLVPAAAFAKPRKTKPAGPPAAAAVAASTGTAVAFSTTAPASVEQVIEHFKAIDERMTGLSASFTQTVAMGEAGVGQTVEGTVEYSKPGRIRIEHSKPRRQTVVSDGKSFWIYVHDRDQVIETTMDLLRQSDPTASRLLDFGDYSRLVKTYDVAYDSASLTVALKPKPRSEGGTGGDAGRPETDFLLTLKLTGPGHFPAETALQVSQLAIVSRFEQIRFNPSFPEGRFDFKAPPGADVFRNFKPPLPGGEAPRPGQPPRAQGGSQ